MSFHPVSLNGPALKHHKHISITPISNSVVSKTMIHPHTKAFRRFFRCRSSQESLSLVSLSLIHKVKVRAHEWCNCFGLEVISDFSVVVRLMFA